MISIKSIVSEEALEDIVSGERSGIHGRYHWFKVASTASLLAELEGGIPEVAFLFGWYHDCRRHNDGIDIHHGSRAADLVRKHYKNGWLLISEDDMEILAEACSRHSYGELSRDKTIACCWDADRLDLPRCGTQVDARYLSTESAKKLAILQNDIYTGDYNHAC